MPCSCLGGDQMHTRRAMGPSRIVMKRPKLASSPCRYLDKASSRNLTFRLKYGQLFMMWQRRVLASYSSAVALSINQCVTRAER